MSDERVRLAAWVQGEGIEIGALHRPLEVPPDAHVIYVDRLEVPELRDHYRELADEALVPVSVIASAEDLSAFADESLDFVIANHLLEHVEYPVRALKEFWRVLKPRGILYLALPDRRLTFDRKRPPTSIRHLLEEHAHGAEGNRRAHYFEWATMVDDKQGAEAEAHTERLMLKSYSIHYHVWTPDEFLDLLVTIRREFDLNFQLVGYAAPISEMDNEFIMVLARPSAPRDVRLMPQRDVAALKARPEAMRPASLRRTLAQSPIGPPVRFVKRLLRRWVSKRFCA